MFKIILLSTLSTLLIVSELISYFSDPYSFDYFAVFRGGIRVCTVLTWAASIIFLAVNYSHLSRKNIVDSMLAIVTLLCSLRIIPFLYNLLRFVYG